MSVSFDVGSYNLICCSRKDNNFSYNREVNAFFKIQTEDQFTLNMMKDSKKVPIVEREHVAYVLGEAAVKMAYTFSDVELKRPMQSGCINPKEKDAFDIMNVIIQSLLEGNIKQDKEILYYSVPANAINSETDSEYHAKVLESIFKAYQSKEGYKVSPFPINEGLALIYAELEQKAYTGVGISMGSGLVNVCLAMFGVSVLQFSIANSGDWIDKMAAKAACESIAFINQEKTKINLSVEPKNLVERAIQTQYRIMIEKTVLGFKKGLQESTRKIRSDGIDIVIAGGVSIPVGFDLLFKEVLMDAKLPININSIVRPPDPLHSVARGCLLAAEHSTR